MSYREELKKVYDDHLEKIKALYDKHAGTYASGQLDGEPWVEEERKLKREMLEKIDEIDKKYREIR